MVLALEERILSPPDEYESLFLRRLKERPASADRRHVLDLGRPCGENVQFFSGLNYKVTIADFFDSLTEAAVTARRGPEPFGAACTDLLGFTKETRFDLVLVWDLFNYLSLDEIGVLMLHLGRYCAVSARLLALVSIYQRIPDRPFRCFALSSGRVRYECETAGERESPRHREPDLLTRLAGFEVETSLLLKGGMREYGFFLGEDV